MATLKQKVVLEAIRGGGEVTEYRITYLYNRESLYGKRVGDFIPPSTLQAWIHATEIHGTGLEFEIRMINSNGG